ncbi:MAG: SH3 domain-containing protein [Pseudomonadota bacterium]
MEGMTVMGSRLLSAALFACILTISDADRGAWAGEPPLGSPSQVSTHRVVGVAANDVLNIRAEPTAASRIVGSFQPGAIPVEVIERRGGWGRVISGEGTGWVSMRYLGEAGIPTIGSSRTNVATVCVGTEPFWDLTFEANGQVRFSDAATGQKMSFAISEAGGVSGRPNKDYFWLEGSGTDATLTITRAFCTDGMSDRLYGREAAFVFRNGDGAYGLEGCCFVPGPR